MSQQYPAEIVRSFQRDETAESVQGVIREIGEVLASQPSEDQLEPLLSSLGCEICFEGLKVPASRWLTQVSAILQQGIGNQFRDSRGGEDNGGLRETR